jgi:Kef-type K+ transport system membrane component KefB
MVIAIGGPPGNGAALFLGVVAILISVAVLAEALGRRETRRDHGRVSDE